MVGGHLLRAQPPPDRQHGRLPDPGDGLRAVAGRATCLGADGWGSSRWRRSSRRASWAASPCCGTCPTRFRSRTPAWRRSSSASRPRSPLATVAGLAAVLHAVRRGARRCDAAEDAPRSRRRSCTCRSSMGATMRHTDAGLAIPDFPWAFGRLVPPHWSPQIAIHFAHRVGALIVATNGAGHGRARPVSPPTPPRAGAARPGPGGARVRADHAGRASPC